jgi:hypothetical protein
VRVVAVDQINGVIPVAIEIVDRGVVWHKEGAIHPTPLCHTTPPHGVVWHSQSPNLKTF